MNKTSFLLCAFALLICGIANRSVCSADEVILETTTTDEKLLLGDFQCSTYRAGSARNFHLMNRNGMEFTAGELWSFFDEQGLNSVHELVICLDVEQLSSDERYGLERLELEIENLTSNGQMSRYTLGDHSLIVPGSQTNSDRAECRLVVGLDFDFMKRFSRSSTEKVRLNLISNESRLASPPIVFIEGRRSIFTWPNLIWLSSFCGFWVAVFWLLRRFTLPSKSREIAIPPVRTVMSLRSLSVAASDSIG